MKTVLGIDLGTQSLKIVFYEHETKTIEAVAASALDVDRDDAGKAEQLAAWWLDALTDALAKVPARVRESVEAIGVSGQQHGFVALDAQGAVLAPVKLWCDTATQTEADEINAAVGGGDRAIEISGNRVVTGYTAPKIRWLKKHDPDAYAKLAHILLPHDYVNYVLTGRLRMEPGDASGTGLLDVRARDWSQAMLHAVDDTRDIASLLPPLVEAHALIGTTTAAAAERFGLPASVPVSAGGGDNMMGAVGTGNVTPGKLTMSLGTSGTLYAYSESPVVDPTGNIAAFCSSTGGWLPLLCTLNCTIATEITRSALDIGLDDFDACIETAGPGSSGLVSLPFFQGERTPDLPFAQGCLIGMTAQNTNRENILRATVEGATFGLRLGIDELGKLGLEASEVVLTGGGANSRVWRQIVADVCALPVTMLAQDEGAAFGAALHALWALERNADPSCRIADIANAHLTRDATRCTEPAPDNVAAYARAYADYKNAVAQISPFFSNQRGSQE